RPFPVMNMRNVHTYILCACLVASTVGARTASAQSAAATEATAKDEYYSTSFADVIGHGILVARGVLLHMRAGAEAGYVDNVFYANGENPTADQRQAPIGAGLLQQDVSAQLSTEQHTQSDLGEYGREQDGADGDDSAPTINGTEP